MKRFMTAFLLGSLILCALMLSVCVSAEEEISALPLPLDGSSIAVHPGDTLSVEVPVSTVLKIKTYRPLIIKETCMASKLYKDAGGYYEYVNAYVNPGKTLFHVESESGPGYVECEMSVVQVKPLPKINECESDNGSVATAPDLKIGSTLRALCTYEDHDLFRITVEQPTTLKLAVTLHGIDLQMYLNESDGRTCLGYVEPKPAGRGKTRTTTRTYTAMPGVYYLSVWAKRGHYNPCYGQYDVKLTGSKAKYSVKIDAPSTLSEGVSRFFEYSVKPSALYSGSLPISFSVDKDSPVLELKGDMVTGRKPGTTKLVADLYGKKFTKKIKVV